MYDIIDRDGNGPFSASAMLKYSSYKKYSNLKTFKRSYNISYPKGVWLDCQSIYEDTTLLKRLGATGGVTIYGENFPKDVGELVNEPWANIALHYNVVFRGKTSATLSKSGVM